MQEVKSYPLAKVIRDYADDEVKRFLSGFSCSRNPDVEKFLKKNAVLLDSRGYSKTYLEVDSVKESPESLDDLNITAYFTLSLSPVGIPHDSEISKSFRKKIGDPKKEDFAAYLIGQLGRDDSADKNILSGKIILKTVIDTIKRASDIAGGRLILAECEDTLGLVGFYESHGFREVNRRSGEAGELIQYLRVI